MITPLESEFEDKTRSMLAGLASVLRKSVKLNDIKKINIFLNLENNLGHKNKSDGTYQFYSVFDVSAFLRLTIPEQKNALEQFVYNILKDIFESEAINVEHLVHAFQTVKEKKLTNMFSGPISRLGDLSAKVICVQSFEKSEIYLEIKKKRTLVEKHFVKTMSQNEFAFSIYLVSPSWKNSQQVIIQTIRGDEIAFSLSEH